MGSWKKKNIGKALLLSLLIVGGSTTAVTALQSSSLHFGLDEVQFNSGGVLHACDASNNLCSDQSLGELGVGDSSSFSGQVKGGSTVTDRQPYIEFKITGATSLDVGTLTSATTKVASTTFSVKTYLAGGGYKVINASPGPQNNGYTMHTLSAATPPTIGNEQFGINLVANSCPTNAPALPALGGCTGGFGANPVQVPDSTFSNGTFGTGYGTANNYKYVNGDTIASSSTSTGETDYTISYMFNISDVTPGGTYIFHHVIVATSTY